MTPHQILWNIPLSLGRQLEAMWWRLYIDRSGMRGIEVKPLHPARAAKQHDRITG